MVAAAGYAAFAPVQRTGLVEPVVSFVPFSAAALNDLHPSSSAIAHSARRTSSLQWVGSYVSRRFSRGCATTAVSDGPGKDYLLRGSSLASTYVISKGPMPLTCTVAGPGA